MENTNKQPRNTLRNKFSNPEVYLWTNEKWATINQRTINGAYAQGKCASRNPQQQSYIKKNIRLEMDKLEFYDYCASHEYTILEMMDNYQRPSIDRVDDSKGYSLDNIRIIPLIDNIQKGKEGSGKISDKLQYQLANRRAYLQGQNYQTETKLVIDYYFNLIKGSKLSMSLIKSLINEGVIVDPFAKANENTIYADESITAIKDAIAKYDEEEKVKKEAKAANLIAKAEKINEKQLELLDKQARLAIINSPKYQEIYDFVRLRKQALRVQAKGKCKSIKTCNLDDRIISEKTKELAINIIANDIPLLVKSIKEARSEQPKPTHRNISWDSTACLYVASFTKNKQVHYLGRFETEAEAVAALIAAKTKLEGEK